MGTTFRLPSVQRAAGAERGWEADLSGLMVSFEEVLDPRRVVFCEEWNGIDWFRDSRAGR